MASFAELALELDAGFESSPGALAVGTLGLAADVNGVEVNFSRHVAIRCKNAG
jgi:hypothetical protein